MKKFSGKIKLNQYSKAEMEQRKLNALKGGCVCVEASCTCGYICPDWDNRTFLNLYRFDFEEINPAQSYDY